MFIIIIDVVVVIIIAEFRIKSKFRDKSWNIILRLNLK